jgi:hypothetical protein
VNDDTAGRPQWSLERRVRNLARHVEDYDGEIAAWILELLDPLLATRWDTYPPRDYPRV